MSKLIAGLFKDEHKAEEVRHDLQKMEREDLADLEDAVVLVKTRQGKVKIHHMSHLTAEGAVTGGFIGTLSGIMVLNPVFAVLGLVAGTTIGLIEGSTIHLGIDEEFLHELTENLTPGTSALGIQIRQTSPETVMEELEKYDAKRVLQTSLSEEDKARLREAVSSAKIKGQ